MFYFQETNLKTRLMKPKALLLCAATGILLCSTSCIKDEAPNAEADILTCTVPADILKR